VKKKDIEVPLLRDQPTFGKADSKSTRTTAINSFHEALQRAANSERSLGTQLKTMRDDLADTRPRNIQPFYVHSHWYDRHPEKLLAQQAIKHMSGHGSHQDHHKLHKLMVDSFQGHPDIMHAYNRTGRQTSAPPAPRRNGVYADT
jgi:hypothetical protein